jgi:hypothetical protein
MAGCAPCSVAVHGCGEVVLDVGVVVVGDVEYDLDDGAAGERELGAVFLADGVAGVVADAESFAGEGVAGEDRSDLGLCDDFVVYV